MDKSKQKDKKNKKKKYSPPKITSLKVNEDDSIYGACSSGLTPVVCVGGGGD